MARCGRGAVRVFGVGDAPIRPDFHVEGAVVEVQFIPCRLIEFLACAVSFFCAFLWQCGWCSSFIRGDVDRAGLPCSVRGCSSGDQEWESFVVQRNGAARQNGGYEGLVVIPWMWEVRDSARADRGLWQWSCGEGAPWVIPGQASSPFYQGFHLCPRDYGGGDQVCFQ